MDADWTVRAATLDWSVERTVVHMIGGPAKYTLYLASRSPTFIAVTLPSAFWMTALSCCQAQPVEPQAEPVESISAVTLVTLDMAESVAFYEALNFRLLYGGAVAPFTSFRVGNGYLNLQLGTNAARVVWGRVVFWVDDVDAMYQRAVAAGFAPATSPANAAWGERYFHIHDPDGHELSFARPVGAGSGVG